MAPQVPETPATTNATATPEELKAAVEAAAEVAKKADTFQRSQTDRKRGWHDYQVLVSGNTAIFDSVCTVSNSGANTYDEDALNGWNNFDVNGTNRVVNFVTAPPSYGRFPNYKATDRAIQGTDAAIIVIQPSPWLDSIDYSFDAVKNSYEGKNANMYHDYWGNNEPVSPPSEKELAALKTRTNRPVAIVLLASSEGFYTHANYRNYDDSLKALRKACAKFMQDYGDANQVRLFEITNPKDKTEVNKVVSQVLADLEDARGIRFTPPTVVPWESDSKKFDTLNVVSAKKVKSSNNRSLWSKFTKLLTGRA